MENETCRMGFVVQEFTSGDVRARIQGVRRCTNSCVFRLSLQHMVPVRGKPEYSYSFYPSDVDDLLLVLLQVKKWYRNPMLVANAIEKVDRWYDQYHLPG